MTTSFITTALNLIAGLILGLAIYTVVPSITSVPTPIIVAGLYALFVWAKESNL